MERYWLIKIRHDKGLTQKQVADLIGLSRAYYTQIENGDRNITLRTAKKMSVELGIAWQVFFDND